MRQPPAKMRRLTDEWRWLYAAIVVLIAAVWLYTLMIPRFAPDGTLAPRGFISPLIAYVMLMALIRPFSGTRRHRTLVIAATALMSLWMLYSLGSILAPFIVAFIIAYILHPLVDRLVRKGLPRVAAVAVVTVPIIALLVVAIVLGIPALATQIESLIEQLPEAVQRVVTSLENLRDRVARTTLPFGSNQQVVDQLTVDQNKISEFLHQQQQEIIRRAWAAVRGVGKGFTFLLTLIGYIVLTPVLMIYLLKDFNGISQRVQNLIPVQQRAKSLAFLREFDNLVSRFLRGQVIAAAIVGVLTWLGLMLLGVPYSGLIGVIAGVFNVVPYLGLLVSVVPVILIAVLSGDFMSIIVKAGIVFGIVQLIDSTVTGPRIVGDSIGLHPVLVILALAVGSFFFGFVGLLLAMPAAVLIKLLLRDALVRYRMSAVYLGAPPGSE